MRYAADEVQLVGRMVDGVVAPEPAHAVRGAVEPVVAELLADEEREHGGGAVERDVADAVLEGEGDQRRRDRQRQEDLHARRARTGRTARPRWRASRTSAAGRGRSPRSARRATTAGRATKRRNLSRPFSIARDCRRSGARRSAVRAGRRVKKVEAAPPRRRATAQSAATPTGSSPSTVQRRTTRDWVCGS